MLNMPVTRRVAAGGAPPPSKPATWENGPIMCYKAMEENPPDSQDHVFAKKTDTKFF